MLNNQDWRPGAAYLYILHLDGAALAWEYLRRNGEYQRDWRQRPRASNAARHWGLRALENPLLDARSTEPHWLVDPDALTRLTADRDPTTSPLFNLWEAPGFKRLTHDGHRLHLINAVGHRQLRFALEESVQHGQPVAYLVRPDQRAPAQYRAIEMQRRAWTTAHAQNPTYERPDRAALLHMRCLQVIDGVNAGASQRMIASVLFGVDWVDERWNTDSDLRNQIRYLLRRARGYLNGGYHRLLSQIKPSE